MIAVISPAKKLNFNADSPIKAFTQCDFLDESKKLVDKAKDYTFDDIMKLMSVSENIANITVQRFQVWKLPFDEQNAKQAALAFNGDTYTGLGAETFSQDDFNYSQDHLRILSGLYGLLRPLDLIQPYRLEMGTTMNNSKGKNLYEFWGTTLNVPVIKPIFKDVKNGIPKVISFFAKRARGMMSKFIIKNRVQSIDDLHGFNDNGYEFQPDQSENHELLFIRG